jgi:hypothetical protein
MAGAKRKRNYSDDEKMSHQANIQFSRDLKKIKAFELQKAIKTLGKDPTNPALQVQVELLKVRSTKCYNDVTVVSLVIGYSENSTAVFAFIRFGSTPKTTQTRREFAIGTGRQNQVFGNYFVKAQTSSSTDE